ncbi:MAG: hypothetical protein BWY85_00657 [Firmicutes bacterium ADurb.Bin506]|jgi:hypothetical protein|nr:MAG: hypothetical protein BWY85_00657 [Firmicutes bacterium ADurb.Bin506]
MLTVVFVASNRAEAELIGNVLKGEGIPVVLRPVGVPQMGDYAEVEVMVAEPEADEAREVLDAYACQ